METKNELIVRKLIEEGFNNGNLDALDDLFSADFVEHQDGIMPANLDGLKGAIKSLRSPFPDLHLTIEDIIATGDKTWVRISAHGSHLGNFMGHPPSGRPFTITVIDICRFEEGRIAEHWGVADRLSQMMQLGLLPQPQRV